MDNIQKIRQSIQKIAGRGNIIVLSCEVVSVEGETCSVKIDENEYNLWVYNGFEGSFTGWLIPYVEPAYKIELRDQEYPQKNELYYVIGTEINFSSSGDERKIQ
jgi:hypothetical protein